MFHLICTSCGGRDVNEITEKDLNTYISAICAVDNKVLNYYCWSCLSDNIYALTLK